LQNSIHKIVTIKINSIKKNMLSISIIYFLNIARQNKTPNSNAITINPSTVNNTWLAGGIIGYLLRLYPRIFF
tara:strand:- start:647 stop:865 length:219 start_codon:yes stop_codon:yes gene_type:complete